ncbi:MAG: DUF721 domain-containing protein, partial [Caldiserica bacterium]|nr:DUF721 domain-containing protein [Caldisericota bacterium]
MKRIGSVLNEFLVKRELYLKIKGNLSVFKWDEIVGQKLADFTSPLSYKDGVLLIGVINPLLERELNYMKNDIIEKINTIVPNSPVKRIRFRIIERLPIRERKQVQEDTLALDGVQLEEEDLKWINNVINRLKVDDKLKKKYKKLLTVYKQDQKLKLKKGY